jgi:hypothetical protein
LFAPVSGGICVVAQLSYQPSFSSTIILTMTLFVARSMDSSHSITSPQNSSHSSQDSLHRGPHHQQQMPQSPQIGLGSRSKKKGIRSSLGRIFSKKDKAARKDLYLAAGRPELSTETDLRLPSGDNEYRTFLYCLYLARCSLYVWTILWAVNSMMIEKSGLVLITWDRCEVYPIQQFSGHIVIL